MIKGPSNQTNRSGVLLFATVRDEIERLPYFLDYYRRLGVTQFFFVENESRDDSLSYLCSQSDCAVWQAGGSYKAARFGMDWQNYLLRRYGNNRWCLSVDADEFLVYSGMNRVDLNGLTAWLDAQGRDALGALMLDMYPSGPLSASSYHKGENPFDKLCWFDAGPYRATRQTLLKNLWVQGGVRERVFFADAPMKSPTLNKIPLVRWRGGYAYVNSTHSMLPRELNGAYISMEGKPEPSGALLHAKFLPSAMKKSVDPAHKGEHFSNSAEFDAYFDAVAADPVLYSETSMKYRDPEQLADLGLITPGSWADSL